MVIVLLVVIIALLTAPGRAFLATMGGAAKPVFWLLVAWFVVLAVYGIGAAIENAVGPWVFFGGLGALLALGAWALFRPDPAPKQPEPADPEH